MALVDIMIIVATILGVMFPITLVNAIRCKDEDKAEEKKIACGIIFGAIVYISLAVINSGSAI